MLRGRRILAKRYELLEEVGAGGTGTVHRARDLRSREIVAVKLLHASLTSNPAFAQRFRREASIAKDIASPHIARVIDFGSDDGTPFIVMEFVEGVTLQQLLAENGPLQPEQALSIMAQVAAALRDAHAKGIVHRDIKPSNIKILPDGLVKVLDFGIAKVEDGATITLAGAVFGSVHYMAPEQAQGEEDARSDIYSLGVVAYELLAGRPPFHAESPWAIVRMHLEADPPSLAEARPDVREGVATVVARCLQKLPEERYQTAGELLAAIEETGLAARFVSVRPKADRRIRPQPGRRISKLIARRSPLLVGTLFTAVALAAIITVAVWYGPGGGGSKSGANDAIPETSTATASATPSQTPATTPIADLIAAESARLAAAGTPICPPHEDYYASPATPGSSDVKPTVPTQLTGSSDGTDELWAAIVCISGNFGPGSDRQQLRIYEKRQGTLALLSADVANTYVDFALPEIKDINRDRLNEIVVHSSTSGNCEACGDYKLPIYQIREHVVREVPVEVPSPVQNAEGRPLMVAVPRSVVDLNGDGIYELIAFDSAWGAAGFVGSFSHADSPSAIYVLAWNGQSFSNASSRFTSYFDKEIASLEAQLLEPGLTNARRVSLAISIALNYGHSGQNDTAWSRFSEIVSSVITPCWQQTLPYIEHDLALLVPRPGGPPLVDAPATPQPYCE